MLGEMCHLVRFFYIRHCFSQIRWPRGNISVVGSERVKDATRYYRIAEYKWINEFSRLFLLQPSLLRSFRGGILEFSRNIHVDRIDAASISIKLAIQVTRFSSDYGNVTIRILSSGCSLAFHIFIDKNVLTSLSSLL